MIEGKFGNFLNNLNEKKPHHLMRFYFLFFLFFTSFAFSLIFSFMLYNFCKVFVSLGKSNFNKKIAIAIVTIFSGVNGNHKIAKYDPAIVLNQGMLKYEANTRAMYAQPFVIIQARPKHNSNRGLSTNSIVFLIILLIFSFMLTPPFYNLAELYIAKSKKSII